MARTFVKNVHHNMHRNVNTYPWIEGKLEILGESIKKTGIWRNMVAVPMAFLNGEMTAEQVEALNDEIGLNGIYDGEVMIPWAHHRLEALIRAGEEFFPCTFVALDEDQLLLQMIYENHDDYSGNMQVFLESIFQAKKALESKVAEAGTYDEFKKELPAVFKSKKAWEQMEAKGITSGAIRAFLGDTFDQYEVGYALSTIEGINEGFYTQVQACACGTVRQMDAFDKLCREIYAQDAYPLYFKGEFVDGIAEMIADGKKGLTVVQLTNARKNVKDAATNPLKSFKSDMKKAFNVVNEIDTLTGAADSVLKLADLPEHEGFKDFEDLAEVIKKIEKKRAKEAAEAAEGGEAQDAVDGGGEELDGDDTSGSLEAEDAGEIGEGSARAEGSDEVTSDEIIAGFQNTASGFVAACQALGSLSDEELEAAGDALVTSITDAMTSLAEVGMRVTTKTSLKKLIG